MNDFIKMVTMYDYPSKAYDFIDKREMNFDNYRSLEIYINELLLASDMGKIKDGLSNVLYWGHYRAGYRDVRVQRFRSKVTTEHLVRFRHLVIEGMVQLLTVKAIGMPEFSGMAFVSKVCMFFNPMKYVVLDKKIMQLKDHKNIDNPLTAISFGDTETTIRITKDSQKAYEQWCDICQQIAVEYFDDKISADIERGFFKLIEQGNAEYGRSVIKQIVKTKDFIERHAGKN